MRVRSWLSVSAVFLVMLGIGSVYLANHGAPPAPPAPRPAVTSNDIIARLTPKEALIGSATRGIKRSTEQPTVSAAIAPQPVPRTVDEALESLRSASVAFNSPDKARVDEQFIVEAKLSTQLHPVEMEVLIGDPGHHEVATLKVSDRMAATLSGGSAFEVAPAGPQEQWISDKETTDWNWQVSPKRGGEQFLILSFDALISVNGKEDKRTINTFKRRISVDVSWPQTAMEWLEFVKKTGEDISWIWATLLVPVGGGIWAWIKRRSRLADAASSDMS
jgi:hypothetical protein